MWDEKIDSLIPDIVVDSIEEPWIACFSQNNRTWINSQQERIKGDKRIIKIEQYILFIYFVKEYYESYCDSIGKASIYKLWISRPCWLSLPSEKYITQSLLYSVCSMSYFIQRYSQCLDLLLCACPVSYKYSKTWSLAVLMFVQLVEICKLWLKKISCPLRVWQGFSTSLMSSGST